MSVPSNLKYTESHEWLRLEDDGTLTVGITDHAQAELGDLVYVELPEAGRQVEAREACCVVESTKAASDVYAPLAGEIVAGNEALADTPELVNEQPFEGGWLFRLKPANPADLDGLLSAEDYQSALKD
ncbi:MAG: glycine cleavage system protein GcvH [Lautropia sp.]|nr:glycine cleavage system protein GcvH [Lautropia sp.]